jgi:hypothetical protein
MYGQHQGPVDTGYWSLAWYRLYSIRVRITTVRCVPSERSLQIQPSQNWALEASTMIPMTSTRDHRAVWAC